MNRGIGFLRRLNTGACLQRVRLMSSQEEPVKNAVIQQLTERFQPSHLDVINESYMHNVPKGSELHFKVTVVSEAFQGLPIIKRHRLVNDALKEELANNIHALSITAKTPSQWEASGGTVTKSPPCRGGFGL